MQTDEDDNELCNQLYHKDPHSRYWQEVEEIRKFRERHPNTKYTSYYLREVFAPAEGVDAMPHNLILYVLGIKKYQWYIGVGGG
jgi:hypothetical protein